MKIIIIFVVAISFLGCSAVKVGDYVKYTSNDYIFIKNNFIEQSIDCLELGEMKDEGMEVKYCVGKNYGSHLVQGFIFEHKYTNFEERFIGARLSFKTKDIYTIQCNAETIADKKSGTEYINCMIPQRSFDIYRFIMNSKNDVDGKFSALVGNKKVYNGVIAKEGKALLKKFYQEHALIQWKEKEL